MADGKANILKGRAAIDNYRAAHTKLHSHGWYKGISEDHTPLLEKLKSDLKEVGFNSIEKFEKGTKTLPLINPIKFSSVNTYPELEELIELREQDLIPDTFALQITPYPWIWVGTSNPLAEVLDGEICRKEEIPICNSVCSGASILGSSMFLYCGLVTKNTFSLNENLIDFAVLVLQKIGVSACARISGQHDILANGKKISGVTGISKGNTQYSIGFWNLDFDYDLANKLLKIPLSKKATDHPLVMEDWITSIRQVTGKNIPFSEMLFAIKTAFSEVFMVDLDDTRIS